MILLITLIVNTVSCGKGLYGQCREMNPVMFFMHKQMYLIAKSNISASSIVCLKLHMENNC